MEIGNMGILYHNWAVYVHRLFSTRLEPSGVNEVVYYNFLKALMSFETFWLLSGSTLHGEISLCKIFRQKVVAILLSSMRHVTYIIM